MSTDKRKEFLEYVTLWATGEIIQEKSINSSKWRDVDIPSFSSFKEYRLKPKKDMVRYAVAMEDELSEKKRSTDNLKLVFDYKTNKLKKVSII